MKIFKISLLCFLSTLSFAQEHLLLSEVVLTPTQGEYIEIYNPAARTIPLDDFYLADCFGYATTPSGNTTVGNADFIARFPAGSSINPGQVLVIAMNGAAFDSTYKKKADFEIKPLDVDAKDMIHIHVDQNASLTNTGESIILFYWDGVSDLVKDVDMVNAGMPSAANQIMSKSNLEVDGPDADTLKSVYLNDQNTMPLQNGTPGFGFSTKRILNEIGNELLLSGNGIIGHDETTENIALTWDNAASYSPPNPGVYGPSTKVVDHFIPEVIISPNPIHEFATIQIQNEILKIKSLHVFSALGLPIDRHIMIINNQLDLTCLASGMYYLEIEFDNEITRWVQKIIKE